MKIKELLISWDVLAAIVVGTALAYLLPPYLMAALIKDLYGVGIPPITLQSAFAEQMAAVYKMMGLYRSASTESDNLFTSLQQRAFRGEL